jgi:tRNA(fMet)-specific endonuclease VapC
VVTRFALDTNTLSEATKRNPHKGLVRFLDQHSNACAIPAPVWHELWYGCLRLPDGRRRHEIRDWLVTVEQETEVLSYDRDASTWHASERAKLAALGRPPPYTDAAIASIAFTRGLTLVTANVADFAAFDGLELLDWRKYKRISR